MRYAHFVSELSLFVARNQNQNQMVRTLKYLSPPRVPHKFGEEFGQELIKTRITLPILKYLPVYSTSIDAHVYHMWIDGLWIAACALRLPDGEETITPKGMRARGFACAVIGNPETSRFTYYYQPLGGDFPEAFDAEEMLATCDGPDKLTPEVLEWSARRVINALLYIYSGDPDLREYRPPGKELPRRERDNLVRQFGNEAAFLVSWDWKKPKVYNVDSTVVSGHYRWQPCGPGLSRVKRIWIDSHVRSYGSKE